jgi:hypothetical protein
MRKAAVKIRLEAESLQHLVQVGGLDIPLDRALPLLVLFSALMASCNRLAAVEPEWANKPGPERERKR